MPKSENEDYVYTNKLSIDLYNMHGYGFQLNETENEVFELSYYEINEDGEPITKDSIPFNIEDLPKIEGMLWKMKKFMESK